MDVAGENKRGKIERRMTSRWQVVVIFPEVETIWEAEESGMHSCFS